MNNKQQPLLAPMYNSRHRNIKKYIINIELQGTSYQVSRKLSVPSNTFVGYLGEILIHAMGCGVGHRGQSYAIPTMHGGIEDIRPYVDEFIRYAAEHPELFFYVTRIGCGIAGFKDREIAPLFAEARELKNVCLPKGWR